MTPGRVYTQQRSVRSWNTHNRRNTRRMCSQYTREGTLLRRSETCDWNPEGQLRDGNQRRQNVKLWGESSTFGRGFPYLHTSRSEKYASGSGGHRPDVSPSFINDGGKQQNMHIHVSELSELSWTREQPKGGGAMERRALSLPAEPSLPGPARRCCVFSRWRGRELPDSVLWSVISGGLANLQYKLCAKAEDASKALKKSSGCVGLANWPLFYGYPNVGSADATSITNKQNMKSKLKLDCRSNRSGSVLPCPALSCPCLALRPLPALQPAIPTAKRQTLFAPPSSS